MSLYYKENITLNIIKLNIHAISFLIHACALNAYRKHIIFNKKNIKKKHGVQLKDLQCLMKFLYLYNRNK